VESGRAWGRATHQHYGRDGRQLAALPLRHQFTRAKPLDEAYVLFFGAFGTAWDDAMVARWSANPPSAVQRPVVLLAAG
jgi:hypothetical protein